MLPEQTWRQAQDRGSTTYPSDLSDEQWKIIQRLIPREKPGGRRRTTSMRAVVNAIFYLVRSGCAWRYLPKSFPPWRTVYDYFRSWKISGLIDQVHKILVARCREEDKRDPHHPHVLIIDSQSVRCQFGETRGWDGFKKVRGRKRHILVDTLGLIHSIATSTAFEKDHEAAIKMFDPKLSVFKYTEELYADGSYRVKRFFEHLGSFFGISPSYNVSSTEKKDDRNRLSKKVLDSNLKPVRWIVERTFAWLNHYRRLSRDFERTISSSEAMVKSAMIQIMLTRLSPSENTSWKCH